MDGVFTGLFDGLGSIQRDCGDHLQKVDSTWSLDPSRFVPNQTQGMSERFNATGLTIRIFLKLFMDEGSKALVCGRGNFNREGERMTYESSYPPGAEGNVRA